MEDYYGFVVDRKGISAKYSTYRGYESYIGSIVKVEITNIIKVYTKIVYHTILAIKKYISQKTIFYTLYNDRIPP